ncbi:MAG: TolC family protein [Siphonobacter sp.]
MKSPLLIICLFLSAYWASGQTKMTLKEAVDIAIKNNLTVKQNQVNAEGNQALLNQSKMALLPYAYAGASQASQWGRSIDPYTNQYINQKVDQSGFSVNAGITVFNGFALRNIIKQNDLLLKASEQDVQQAKDLVTINTLIAYLQVLSSEDQVTLATQQLEASKMQLERTAELVKAGNMAPSDEYTLQAQVATNKIALVNVQGQLKLNRLTFWQTLNNPQLPLDFTLERVQAEGEIGYPTTATQIYESARQNLAISKAADLRVLSAERGINVQQGYLYPVLKAYGNLNTYTSSTASLDYGQQLKNNFYQGASLSLSIPIFYNKQYRYQVQKAVIARNTAQISAQTTQLQLKQNIEQAYANLEVAQMRYDALDEQVKVYNETVLSAEVRFQSGTLNVVEYNIAKSNLDQARLNQIQARYEYLFRMKVLDYYQGKNLFID